eukprot:GHVN01011740.1.p1 GENE.GHVN01011740.1~~GHVN01011740.1.p1  ORF type:complete len:274 (+),score=77.87 GHVN01011740.1:57-878(+)
MEKGMEMKFSLLDLINSPNQTAEWDGVRNYQARNVMKDMKCGDLAFFYHSNCKPPGVVGIVRVVREAYSDHTQFDSKNPHFDPSSDQGNPRWIMVDVKYVRTLKRMISLDELKLYKTTQLRSMDLFTKARLSCQKVSREEWMFLHALEELNEGETPEGFETSGVSEASGEESEKKVSPVSKSKVPKAKAKSRQRKAVSERSASSGKKNRGGGRGKRSEVVSDETRLLDEDDGVEGASDIGGSDVQEEIQLSGLNGGNDRAERLAKRRKILDEE